MLQVSAIKALQSLTPAAIDLILGKNIVPTNLFNQIRILLPRTVVDTVSIFAKEENCRIEVVNTDETKEIYEDISYDEDFPRICYRLKTERLLLHGDFMVPKIDFNWVNHADIVAFYDAENRSNIDVFLEKFNRIDMDFHSKIPVPADDVLRSMSAVSIFSYSCGETMYEESCLSKETLRILAEKSHLCDGVIVILLYHGKGVSGIGPQDITDFLRNAKFDEDAAETDRIILIEGVSGTKEAFAEHLIEEDFIFEFIEDRYQIYINYRQINVQIEFDNS